LRGQAPKKHVIRAQSGELGFGKKTGNFTLEGGASRIHGPSFGVQEGPEPGDKRARTLKARAREGQSAGQEWPEHRYRISGYFSPGSMTSTALAVLVTGIVSQRWPWITVQPHVEAALSPATNSRLVLDAISWKGPQRTDGCGRSRGKNIPRARAFGALSGRTCPGRPGERIAGRSPDISSRWRGFRMAMGPQRGAGTVPRSSGGGDLRLR